MNKAERVVMLEEARELIAEALGKIRDASEKDPYVEAYLCAPLSIMVEEGEYLSHDITIAWVIERVGEGIETDGEEMASIDDQRGRGYGDPEGDCSCANCGSSSIAPPCPACGERVCQDCEDHHVCDPE